MSLTYFENNPFYIGCLMGIFFSYYIWNIVNYFSRARQNRRDYEELAHQLGFEFYESKWLFEKNSLTFPPPVPPYRPRKPFFSGSPSWTCQNILKGSKEGREILFLERDYQDREFKNVAETMALFSQPEAGLPHFELVPRRLFDKFHRRMELEINDTPADIKMKLIEPEGLGDFTRPSHYLWGAVEEEARIKSLMTKEFWIYLEQFPNWRLKALGDWVVVFEENILVPAVKVLKFVEQSARAASFIFKN
jgi:hypothetical protein